MARERNKPTQSWMERAKIEIEHEEELTFERAYELGKIRGKKEQKAIDDDHLREVKKMVIDKACEWLYKNILCMQHDTKTMFLARFRKAMQE